MSQMDLNNKWRRAKVNVTFELLKELLHFPSNTRIIAVSGGDPVEQAAKQIFTIVVESPDLPEVWVGQELRRLAISVEYHFDWGLDND